MSRWTKILLIAGSLLTVCAAWVTWNELFDVEAEPRLTYKHLDGREFSSNYLLEIPIYGEIMVDASDSSLFWLNTATYSVHVQKLLQQASADARVKGILLRLNTGGGSATGSKAIYQALVNYRETTKKPIVAHIEELSASGGVMSMMGADAVYAAPGSSIGSIGVVTLEWLTYDRPTTYTDGQTGESISSDNGIERIVISAGKGKDLMRLSRKPTDEEMKVMREGVNNIYNTFVKTVSEARGIPEETIREQMGAYLFDNKQAEEWKLIDGTKSRADAIANLAQRAKVGDDFRVVRAKEPSSLLPWLSSTAQLPTFEQKQQMLNRDRCAMTEYRTLAYYGNLQYLCR